MANDIFISYSRHDLDAVKPIKEELEAQGFSCWMDLEGIESGSEEFTDHLVAAIDTSAVLLFFLSDSSQKSEWSLKEIRFAKRKQKRIVLVRFNDDQMTDSFDFNFGGADIIDWRVPEQKEKLLRDLSKWLEITETLKKTSPSTMRTIANSRETSIIDAKGSNDERGHNRPIDKNNCEVKIEDVPISKKIAVMSAVRQLTGLGLVDSKRIVENRGVVTSGINYNEADKIRESLEAVGAVVVIL